MLEEGATEGIHIGIWVLDFADFAQDARDGVEAFPCQVADVVVLDMLVSVALQVHESRIRIPQDCVAVPWDHSA